MTADELSVLVRKLLRGVNWSDPYSTDALGRHWINFDWGASEDLTDAEFALCKRLYEEHHRR